MLNPNTDTAPDHWDPKPDEFLWFREAQSGERGHLVARDGKWFVSLEKAGRGMEILRRYSEGEFKSDLDKRPMTRAQLAKVAYVADCELRRALGDKRPQREWQSLHPDERIRFTAEGPATDAAPARKQLYDLVFQLNWLTS